MKYDVIIIGAGAAGLMCAITAGKRGRKILVLDHANKAGKKILMSGGGRCNFTNWDIHPNKYISQNPHFCKSALARYTQWDFIAMVSEHNVAWHEKKLGQLFCDNSSKDILNMLLAECEQAGVSIRLNTSITNIEQTQDSYQLTTDSQTFDAESLVVACGGLSIPRMGASGFGYDIAKQFGLNVLDTTAALVPFTLSGKPLEQLNDLSGVALADVRLFNDHKSFSEAILITHRGISGPAALQLSSYWQAGESIYADLIPNLDLASEIKSLKQNHPQWSLGKALSSINGFELPNRFTERFFKEWVADTQLNTPLQTLSHSRIEQLDALLHQWPLKPSGTEGYRTAEVTLGGVDTDELSSTTMASKKHQSLYFIGEVVDVTGWLGGYNFQWAWASGYAAGSVC